MNTDAFQFRSIEGPVIDGLYRSIFERMPVHLRASCNPDMVRDISLNAVNKALESMNIVLATMPEVFQPLAEPSGESERRRVIDLMLTPVIICLLLEAYLDATRQRLGEAAAGFFEQVQAARAADPV